MFRKVIAVAAIGFTALALSSCGNNSELTPYPSNLEPRVALGEVEISTNSNSSGNLEGAFEINLLKIVDINSGEVIVGGSGSCPPVPTGATYEDGLLEVELSEGEPDRICTMDLRQYSIPVELQDVEWDLQTEARIVQGDQVTDLEVICPEENSDEDAQ